MTKRYQFVTKVRDGYAEADMVEREHGEFVRFADIATAIAERDAARGGNDAGPAMIGLLDKCIADRDALAAARAEVERLKTRLLTAAGDDLCRLTQEEIKQLSSGAVKIPPKDEFLASCERFHAQVASKAGVMSNCLTLAQLVAENEKLTSEVERLKAEADENEKAVNEMVDALCEENEQLTCDLHAVDEARKLSEPVWPGPDQSADPDEAKCSKLAEAVSLLREARRWHGVVGLSADHFWAAVSKWFDNTKEKMEE